MDPMERVKSHLYVTQIEGETSSLCVFAQSMNKALQELSTLKWDGTETITIRREDMKGDQE